jgi:hypothetical protein
MKGLHPAGELVLGFWQTILCWNRVGMKQRVLGPSFHLITLNELN